MSKREIKFKVRLKKEKRLRDAYGLDFLYKKALVIISGSYEWIEYEELFEFIGILDMNDQEIFEGNILQYNYKYENTNRYPILVIEWEDGEFVSKTINSGVSNYTMPIRWMKSAKIIGHIAENPELLTKHTTKS